MLQHFGFPLIFGLALVLACRTTHNAVEVMDERNSSQKVSSDFLHLGAASTTTLVLTSISPAEEEKVYDRIIVKLHDLVLHTVVEQQDYKIGESITIKPYADYEVIVSAFKKGRELYSSRSCYQRIHMRSELGSNQLTAELCPIFLKK